MTSVTINARADRSVQPGFGTVTGVPRLVLQAEGAAVLAVAVTAYAVTGGNWWLFAALFLVPDLFMLGYLRGSGIGAAVYNLGHSYVVALAVVGAGWAWGAPVVLSAGLIWVAHIGFDRAMGYGLKYALGFKATHLSDGA